MGVVCSFRFAICLVRFYMCKNARWPDSLIVDIQRELGQLLGLPMVLE
jgi:hypothetical protein